VRAIQAVIFDVDGVLVDARDWHFEAFNRALVPYSTTVSYAEHLSEFLGMTTKSKLALLVARGKVPAAGCAAILDSKRRYFRELLLARCRTNPGLQGVLEQLRVRGLVLGAASNAARDSVEEMLALAGLRPCLDSVIGGDEVMNQKPDPEIYLKCAARLGTDPDACLVVEDGEYGIQAARAACMHVVVIKSPDELTSELLDRWTNDSLRC
jgi:beta-phosphoglucomutase